MARSHHPVSSHDPRPPALCVLNFVNRITHYSLTNHYPKSSNVSRSRLTSRIRTPVTPKTSACPSPRRKVLVESIASHYQHSVEDVAFGRFSNFSPSGYCSCSFCLEQVFFICVSVDKAKLNFRNV